MRDGLGQGALCFILTLLFFPAQFLAQMASPGYDIFLYDISLLGISSCQIHPVASSGNTDPICSPLYLLFNLGIIAHGALTIAGVWLTRRFWPRGSTTSFALLLLALGGVGAIVVGAFPLDVDMLVHIIGAVLAIAAPGFGLLLLSYTTRHHLPGLASWTLLVAVVILLSGLGHALGGQPFGRGTMERLAVWPQTLWFAGVGTLFLAARRPQKAPVLLRNTRNSKHQRIRSANV